MNIKHIVALFLLFLFCVPALLQAQNFAAAKDPALLQNKMAEASKNIKTIQCDFVQEKNMSMLADKAVSKGKFYFKRDDKVRLDYQQPTKNLIVMNAGKMLMQDDKKTSQMDMHRSKMFQQLNNIIVGSIDGSLFSSKEFSVAFFETATQVKVQLKPTSKMMKNFLSNIVLILDKKDFTATRIEMNEPSGDNTILSFSGKNINGQVDDTLFNIK